MEMVSSSFSRGTVDLRKPPPSAPSTVVTLDDTGVSVFLFLASLVVIAFVVSDLIRVVDVGTNGATSGWERRLTSCRGRTAIAFPLTSIKIVVVAWQIVTQVNERGSGQC